MSKGIKIELEIDKEKTYFLGEEITGFVVISSSEDVDIRRLSYKVCLEIRGLAAAKSYDIAIRTIFSNGSLKKGEKQRHAFSFVNNKYETYKGKNVETLIMMEARMKLKDEPSTNALLSKIGYIKGGEEKKVRKYLTFESRNNRYKNDQRNVKLELNSLFKYVGMTIFVVFFFLLFASDAEYKNLVLMGGFLFGGIWILYVCLSSFLVGKLESDFIDEVDGQFKVKLKNSKSWKSIQRIKATYTVIEEVVDNRGTSSNTERHDVYISKTKEIKSPSRDAIFTFDYPKKKIPRFRFEDARIYWKIDIKLYSTVLLEFRYTSEFLVKRVG